MLSPLHKNSRRALTTAYPNRQKPHQHRPASFDGTIRIAIRSVLSLFVGNIAALRELGLEPGATADQIKKAHRARLPECHPDHWPGDTAKTAEAQRVNAAKDALDEMAKDGRLAQYGLKAERDRRVGGGKGTEPLPRILVILGVAGSGALVAEGGKATPLLFGYARHRVLAGIFPIPDVTEDNFLVLHVISDLPQVGDSESIGYHVSLLSSVITRITQATEGYNLSDLVGWVGVCGPDV
jgi:hypothetical protein